MTHCRPVKNDSSNSPAGKSIYHHLYSFRILNYWYKCFVSFRVSAYINGYLVAELDGFDFNVAGKWLGQYNQKWIYIDNAK